MSGTQGYIHAANTPIKIGVISSDARLVRKITLALEGCAVVESIDAHGEQVEGCALVLADVRGGGECTAPGAVPIVERAAYESTVRALPYPFAYGELRSLLDAPCGRARLILSEDGRHVSLDNERIRLTESEHKLLSAIVSGGGEFVSREELVRGVFGEGADGGILNVYVHYLREKLESKGEKIILSSRRGGYRIDEKYLGVVR